MVSVFTTSKEIIPKKIIKLEQEYNIIQKYMYFGWPFSLKIRRKQSKCVLIYMSTSINTHIENEKNWTLLPSDLQHDVIITIKQSAIFFCSMQDN